MKYRCIVTFDAPRMKLGDLREYIIDAIETWGGQRHPDDPLFYGTKNVVVRFDQGNIAITKDSNGKSLFNKKGK